MAVVVLIYLWLRLDHLKTSSQNFHIKLPRCNYTPIMFLDFKEIENIIVTYDDVKNAESVERYANACANYSRKANMTLIFTAQYDKYIPRNIREILDFEIIPDLYGTTLDITIIFPNDFELRPIEMRFRNVFKSFGKLYNTNEKVQQVLESDVIKEIIRFSKTARDVEENLMLWSGDKRERRSMKKMICKKMKIDSDEDEDKDEDRRRISGEGIKYLRDKYKIAWGDFQTFFRIPSTTAYTMYKDYKFNLQNNFKQIALQSDIICLRK